MSAALLACWRLGNDRDCARLSASAAVLVETGAFLKRSAEQYVSPNTTLEEMRAIWRSWEGDPLKSFGEACRSELKAIRSIGPGRAVAKRG